MDPNSYYDDLMKQGYSSNDATHFTQQYYPEFQGQGMAAMAPPPGGMEMGGMAAGGFGASAGGMAAGGAAAAGGGMKIAIISVVSVLFLGGAATGGYFLYDYLTEPDFYGEVYWTEGGIGYIFEEDGIKLAYSTYEGDCEIYEDEDVEVKESGDLCILDLDPEKYSSEDEGDYYEICVTEDGDKECIDIYPFERGMVMKDGKDCNVFVSDIGNPPSWDDNDKFEDWQDKLMDIAEEISDDDDAPKCDYDQFD